MPTSEHYAQRDEDLWQRLQNILREQGASARDILQHWPAYIQRRSLPRFLAHYELFKKILDIPGSIVELGIFRGASFFTWSNLLETFLPCDRSRKVYGFDSFEGLKPDQFEDAKDGERDGRDGKENWAYKTESSPLRQLVELHNEDNLLPGVERCVLVEGDVFDTVPDFIKANPGLRIALLYFDMDLYKPTRFCLEQFYPLVSPGGIVCFDEYALVPWEGETKAVEEYFDNNMPQLRKMPFAQSPGAWFVKKGG